MQQSKVQLWPLRAPDSATMELVVPREWLAADSWEGRQPAGIHWSKHTWIPPWGLTDTLKGHSRGTEVLQKQDRHALQQLCYSPLPATATGHSHMLVSMGELDQSRICGRQDRIIKSWRILVRGVLETRFTPASPVSLQLVGTGRALSTCPVGESASTHS